MTSFFVMLFMKRWNGSALHLFADDVVCFTRFWQKGIEKVEQHIQVKFTCTIFSFIGLVWSMLKDRCVQQMWYNVKVAIRKIDVNLCYIYGGTFDFPSGNVLSLVLFSSRWTSMDQILSVFILSLWHQKDQRLDQRKSRARSARRKKKEAKANFEALGLVFQRLDVLIFMETSLQDVPSSQFLQGYWRVMTSFFFF